MHEIPFDFWEVSGVPSKENLPSNPQATDEPDRIEALYQKGVSALQAKRRVDQHPAGARVPVANKTQIRLYELGKSQVALQRVRKSAQETHTSGGPEFDGSGSPGP